MTEIPFLGGKLRLFQSETGHRAGTDAVLLAATVPDGFAGLVIDAGSASGAAGFAVAARVAGAKLRLVEIDANEAELARKNIATNQFSDRAEVVEGDLLAPHHAREALGLAASDADWVITNPPFLNEHKTRTSPDSNRQRAHTMPEGGLDRWIVACQAMLEPHGRLTMIHRADALSELLSAFEGRFGALSILPIYPQDGASATRLLVEGIKGSRAPLTLMKGLILHEKNGRFTAEAEAIHRGLTCLPLTH